MIAKRIRHKGICDHAQTPYARRKCRAAKHAAAVEQAERAAKLAELGYTTETDVLDAYREATDELSMLAGDGRDRWAAHWVRQRDNARQAMAELNITIPTPARRRFGRAA